LPADLTSSDGRSGLRIGIQLPQRGEAANRRGIVELARAAEDAGLHSLWVSDHVVHPAHSSSRYPYHPEGRIPFVPSEGCLEALTTLAVAAGVTERIGLGTSVLVLPMRETLLAAKVIASLDVLSNGRVILAVAPGWWREEFEALGADFPSRGPRLDEQMVAMTELWRNGTGAMSGQHVSFDELTFEPRPLQPGGPEIWIGGSGRRTWERIATTPAIGWHGVGHDRDAIALAGAGIAEACARAGRDAGSIRLSTTTGLPSDAGRAAERIDALADAGISQVVFIPMGPSFGAMREGIACLAEVAESIG
jgi:probable F420-dependent oxidoreductase